jgi:hypothetical protein
MKCFQPTILHTVGSFVRSKLRKSTLAMKKRQTLVCRQPDVFTFSICPLRCWRPVGHQWTSQCTCIYLHLLVHIAMRPMNRTMQHFQVHICVRQDWFIYLYSVPFAHSQIRALACARARTHTHTHIQIKHTMTVCKFTLVNILIDLKKWQGLWLLAHM